MHRLRLGSLGVIAVSSIGVIAMNCHEKLPCIHNCGPGSASAASGGGLSTTETTSASATNASSSVATTSSGFAGGDWVPLPLIDTLEGCQGGVQLANPSAWPKPIWSACGTGCEVAGVADTSEQTIGKTDQSAAGGVGPELYYRAETTGDSYRYDVLRRASDDVALVVTRVPVTTCKSALPKQDAPLVFEMNGTDSKHRWVAHYRTGFSDMRWPSQLQVLSSALSWFSWNDGWGVTLNPSVIAAVSDSSPTNLTSLSNNGHAVDSGRSRNGLVVWVDWGTFPANVMSWTLASGTKTLFTAPNDVTDIAMSDSTIAFINVTGPNTRLGAYETASIEWLPFTTDPASVQITSGPDISGHVEGVLATATGGDYVAVGYNPTTPNEWGIFVTQMSTKKRWYIPPAPGSQLQLAGMSGNRLIAFEQDVPPAPNFFDVTLFQRWKRWDLSHLDDFATKLP